MVHRVTEKIDFIGISESVKKRRTGEEYTAYTLMLKTYDGVDNIRIDDSQVEFIKMNQFQPLTPMEAVFAVDPTKDYADGIMKVVDLRPLALGKSPAGKAPAASPDK